VTALIHAELLKLRSSRVATFLLLGSLAMVVWTVLDAVPQPGNQNASVRLGDPDLLAMATGSGFGVPLVLVVLLGAMAFTQEFRYGTITSAYLAEPRRPRVLVAKGLALVLASLVVTTATLPVSMPVGIALIGSRDGDVTIALQFWQTIAAAYGVMAAHAVIGVAIGVLVRNQVVAAVSVLVWLLLVEQILTGYPSIGKWTPWGATNALLQIGPTIGLEGKLLSVPAAGLLLSGYTVAAGVLALLLTPKRDVL
jgi:ABC-type transport system involved in multi-copper enzyme maturation permease subunit